MNTSTFLFCHSSSFNFSSKVNFSSSSFPHLNARTKVVLSFITLQLFTRNVCAQTQNQVLAKKAIYPQLGIEEGHRHCILNVPGKPKLIYFTEPQMVLWDRGDPSGGFPENAPIFLCYFFFCSQAHVFQDTVCFSLIHNATIIIV